MTADRKRDAYVREVADSTAASLQSLYAEIKSKYELIQEQNANLANLYVASYRLSEALDRQDVLTVVEEIIINLLGSEELGIYELVDGKLELLRAFGLDQTRWQHLPVDGGMLGQALDKRQVVLATDGHARAAHEENLTACIPLVLENRVVGMIAIFQLLQHKPALSRFDRELCELLSTHAATALYFTKLHALKVAAAEQRS